MLRSSQHPTHQSRPVKFKEMKMKNAALAGTIEFKRGRMND